MYQDTLALPEVTGISSGPIFVFLGLILCLVGGFFVIDALIARSVHRVQIIKTALGIVLLLCGISAWTLSFQELNNMSDSQQARREATTHSVSFLEDNLREKYDFDKVTGLEQLLNVHDMKENVPSFGVPEEYNDDLGFTVTVTIDEKDFLYVLTQDPDTFEPTLSDPPAPAIRGGDITQGAPTASDLLKEKV